MMKTSDLSVGRLRPLEAKVELMVLRIKRP